MSQFNPGRSACALILLASLNACGGGGGGNPPPQPPGPTFTVGGTVSGLSGAGLVLVYSITHDQASGALSQVNVAATGNGPKSLATSTDVL